MKMYPDTKVKDSGKIIFRITLEKLPGMMAFIEIFKGEIIATETVKENDVDIVILGVLFSDKQDYDKVIKLRGT